MKEKIDYLLRAGIELKASDIHLTVGVPPMFRINGELKRYGKETLLPDDTEGFARVVVPESQWDRFAEAGEMDLSYAVPGVSRFRVNVYFQRGCIALAVRVITTKIPSLDELYMPPILKEITEKPQGLVLVTGPTGSGKSTTLAAMIDHMNQTMRKHIITLEDPIEFLHKHGNCIIDQREIGSDTKNFAIALRAALRQDPDAILVGEMRDLETIQTAITAAETGHLVFGTLHTQNAPSSVERIIDVFPPAQQPQIRTQLSATLLAIISQRLFKTANNKERRAAIEVMINNAAIGNLIRSGKIHQIKTVIQTSRAQGMQTLGTSVQELLESGVISMETAKPYLKETVS
ncbi:type IV pilus twitching motility protein PilT [Bacillus sp. B15-48]|uniref:type IV pilus twitching motility protein PilT n=1 Tax=Bacillus sp. B15-48 TaxID=1548601 RepID=UPI00193F2D1A|nr:type IV pilus twitching motility protein PilT [Bacillus sp. B15-48]MBM4762447.1 PilT/PilU family type 4a pilus ATPase [Bacillus sp. B15-48]